jgi:hypothetical protein
MKIKKSVLALLIVTMTTMTGVTVFAADNTATVTTKPKQSLGTRLKNLQTIQQAAADRKAANTATQQERQQIKGLYTHMKTIEQGNHGIYEQILTKRKQVREYITQVSKGKIIYTDAQFTQIGTLSDTLVADVQSIASCTNVIKNDQVAVKASAKAKDYASVINELTTMTTDRQTRGSALTKVNGDLDALLSVLSQGQAVAVSSQPSTTPATTTSSN